MSLPPNVRVNIGAPFPARVVGGSFIVVTKANGIWSITPNYNLLANSPTLTNTQVVAVFDPVSGSYKTMSLVTLMTIFANNYRTVTAAGAVTVSASDIVILMNKTAGAATSVNLPAASTRNGLPLTIKDLKGDANTNNITIVPSGTETIDGFSPAAAAANGVALIDINYGAKRLFPLSSGGWYLV